MKKFKLKVKYTRLGIIANALLNYADTCAVMANTKDVVYAENYNIRLSVATELYYKLQERITKRYPSETYKIPLELHHALVLQSALLRFIGETQDDFQRNAIEIVKDDLNQGIVNQSLTLTP